MTVYERMMRALREMTLARIPIIPEQMVWHFGYEAWKTFLIEQAAKPDGFLLDDDVSKIRLIGIPVHVGHVGVNEVVLRWEIVA